ncbi:hypothetical protein [Erythrobacter sp.]|uniref:hypothetical protein n=1 Tax=Erythrobacter sp. TaxID=1042 RepID=UPI001425C2EB|nr:hypothetical protein [Erythrobacter sp.]QIQ87234.1 MAG: hypothetical protein G9473_11460 [Erythrobacter sp.]
MTTPNRRALVSVAFAPALVLAACGGPEEEPAYEVDAEDLSGGELQVRTPKEGEVPVELPKTEMTNVPPEEVGEDGGAIEPEDSAE